MNIREIVRNMCTLFENKIGFIDYIFLISLTVWQLSGVIYSVIAVTAI